jgi:hypothetical protein
MFLILLSALTDGKEDESVLWFKNVFIHHCLMSTVIQSALVEGNKMSI